MYVPVADPVDSWMGRWAFLFTIVYNHVYCNTWPVLFCNTVKGRKDCNISFQLLMLITSDVKTFV